MNSSSYKVYANSKYWILRKLGGYATDPKKHKLIIEAYHKIIEKLLINHGSNYKDLEDYIKYDVINEIFFRPQSGNLTLIKNLYDDLDDLLYSEPQFFHQKVNDVIEFYKYVVTNNLDIYNLTAIERKNVDEFVTFMFKAQNNEN